MGREHVPTFLFGACEEQILRMLGEKMGKKRLPRMVISSNDLLSSKPSECFRVDVYDSSYRINIVLL